MKKIFFTLCSMIVAIFFWYYLGAKVILKDDSNSFSKLQCVSYAPFAKDESPFLFDKGLVISENQVRNDLKLLSKYTSCIRTYSTVGLELIPKIAKELKLQMLMGAWVSSDEKQTKNEITTLIKLAKQYHEIIRAVIVGNEVLLRGDISSKKLYDYIKEVKTALPNLKVTYADVWEFWLKNPSIKEVTDFVTIHILPYWEDEPANINESIKHLANVRQEVEQILGTSNILIGETGWPSEGRMREDALPSKINQAKFIRDFVSLAKEKNWNYNIIEAFDQPWKRVSEGAVGGYWGLFDKNREDKSVFSGDVSNFPNYKYLAFGSFVLVLLFSLLLRKKDISTKKIFLFSFINTSFAILYMLQVEQYNIISRNHLEFIWATVVLLIQLFVYYFMLLSIVKEKRTNIIPSVLFYLASFIAFILTMNLVFNGRYENFEVYGFTILALSSLWLYKNQYSKLNFGKFEKVVAIVLFIGSILTIYNETFLNIFSNIWVIIALVFVYILNKGVNKNISFWDLKELGVYILLFAAIFLAFKYGFVSNNTLALKCNLNPTTLPCELKKSIGLAVYFGYIGFVTVLIAVIAYIINKKPYSLIALFFSIGSLILTNTFLGSISFLLAVYLLTKDEMKGLN
ncbi:glycosyl hydrolase [Halarcobacter ebronensis]|uniref:Endo-1,3-beta-glucanase btgC n=1 Tax=Halarcobacter ebronensis TaxID=1462615 RepID=A0A4Q1AJQ9_9BACT|nr:glycosyl hydrolase [Halarcobacter ebronensis]QKF81712.1 putative glycosyl hydrolase [Halarcobacter ebronensis]RXK04610.1 glycosyl hydrolase [Halarcobacter ebronensis]